MERADTERAAPRRAEPERTTRIRALVGKPGLDGHDRGAKVVARAYRDAGMEVVYTGLHRTPEEIAEAALQEDVDVVAMSILSGAHMTLVPRVVALLRERGMDDVVVLVGGIIPEEDVTALKAGGVAGCFGPGSNLDAIVAFTREAVARARTQERERAGGPGSRGGGA
jgi:methylmalonyl-CoA mutase C-terminal domain/subunit